MTPQQITELLEEVKPFLNEGGEINKEGEEIKRFIKAYKEVTGKTLGTGKCRNCIMDAYFGWKILTDKELIFLTMERKYKLKETRLVGFKNSHYTNANITDEIALDMVKFNRNHSNSFENGKELLEEFDAITYDSDNTYPKAVAELETPTPIRKKRRGKAKPKS